MTQSSPLMFQLTQTPLFQLAVVGVVAALMLTHVLSSRYYAQRAAERAMSGVSVSNHHGCGCLMTLLVLLLLSVGLVLLALAHQGPFSLGVGLLNEVRQ